jgi:hypothetical protein
VDAFESDNEGTYSTGVQDVQESYHDTQLLFITRKWSVGAVLDFRKKSISYFSNSA